MPKNNAITAISTYISDENPELILKSRNENNKHTEKQSSIDFRRPIVLINHPDINPPINPPIPSIIMLKPRSFWPSLFIIGKSGDVDQANPVQDDHPKLTSNIFFKAVVHSC